MVGPFIFFDAMGPATFRPRHRRGRPAAPAHRARHRHLALRGRAAAPGQPGLHAGDPARRGELDDGGQRHRALGAHAAGEPAAAVAPARHPVLGRAAEARGGNRARIPSLRGRRTAGAGRGWRPAAGHRGHAARPHVARCGPSRRWATGRWNWRRARVACCPPEHEERAVYLVDGELAVDGERRAGRRLRHAAARTQPWSCGPRAPCRCMVLGGEPADGPRHIWWNFVSSSEAAHRTRPPGLEARALCAGAGRVGIHPAAGVLRPPCPAAARSPAAQIC